MPGIVDFPEVVKRGVNDTENFSPANRSDDTSLNI